MSGLITLNCPSCGGRLEVTNDTERYVCAHCGNSHIVDPGVRAESLANEIETLKNESAIRRIESEIKELEKKEQELQSKISTFKNSYLEAAHGKLFLVGLLVVAAIAFVVVGSDYGYGKSEIIVLSIIMAVLFLILATLLGKYGLIDKRTMEMWQTQCEANADEANAIERQLARKREELERRKKLPLVGDYQQLITSH